MQGQLERRPLDDDVQQQAVETQRRNPEHNIAPRKYRIHRGHDFFSKEEQNTLIQGRGTRSHQMRAPQLSGL